MKKFFLTIMAFVYLAAACGMPINMHYCMDKLVSWNMTGEQAKDCTVCERNDETLIRTHFSSNCCKDEFRQVKLEKDHKAEQNIFSKISITEVRNKTNSNELLFVVPIKFIRSYNINAPPQKHKVPDYIFHCVFRI